MERVDHTLDPFGIVIRPYRDADLKPVADLFTASVHELTVREYNATQRMAWAPRPPDLDRWRRRLHTHHTLVAEGDQLAGFISFEPDGHIDLLYTSPRHTRLGVASALYRHVEALLTAQGVTRLHTEASAVARPFFERHGFHVVRPERVVRRGVTFARYAMEKSGVTVCDHGWGAKGKE